MEKRNTKQKELIYNALQNDYTHPTIKQLYEKLKLLDNSIGQATVYRNVKELVSDKKIIKIPTKSGVDHYDYNLKEHYHFECDKCGNIYDLETESLTKIIKKIEGDYGLEIDSTTILFNGVCNRCLNEEV